MGISISSAVPVSIRDAARGAQTLVREVKNEFEDSLDRGRKLARDGRKALSRTATKVDQYADDNTALVVAAALAVGVGLGLFARRRG